MPLLHAPQYSPQRKPGHVGWCSTGPVPLTRATRNGRWNSDWVSWAGQVRMVRNLRAHATACGDPDTEARTRRIGPPGPRHRSRPPGYERSTASAGAQRALVTGRGYPDTDAQLRWLELSGPRPPVSATRMINPGGPVTKDHGPGSSDPDGSLDSRLGPRDQAKAHCYPEYQGAVDHGLNILGRFPQLT